MTDEYFFLLRYLGPVRATWQEPASLPRNRRWCDRRLGSPEHGATDPPRALSNKRRHRTSLPANEEGFIIN
jgi:hypothetical protein